ncbi:MAG: hypothetical protein DWQ31_18285 [Planctomycetota bacterium]|nr:MAG: hypothetical protein DWQ31_18285 [Planctomycetota bacterium]REJ87313.1 MAG: hypothetical protein DWQ35_21625 [Planctomycetota bacterium]REK22674.1 MAG: hypothetical protein DWQ42_16620 [Planctomycetota bacterium]REK42493.1 MAG: hypothetical protein DWQ46_12970 [Planctomycetota bacterium]
MPLTLNVGVNRKIGEANYGSRGASVNLQLELESDLVKQPGRLRDRIRQLFDLAKQSVEEELHGNRQQLPSGDGNGSHSPNRNGRSATQSQLRAIHAIADRHRIDLTTLLREEFDVAQASELSVASASRLIDQLKRQNNGTGGRR